MKSNLSPLERRIDSSTPSKRKHANGRSFIKMDSRDLNCNQTVVYSVQNRMSLPYLIWQVLRNKGGGKNLRGVNKSGKCSSLAKKFRACGAKTLFVTFSDPLKKFARLRRAIVLRIYTFHLVIESGVATVSRNTWR